ncbi:MAG: tRNA (adenosine(37)-N6)-dimethylallyltransferase MiaA [Patescibacteria group bacterium]
MAQLAPLIVIVGQTASGKSGLAMEIAKKYKGEIICADSWTVYKGFDIGTAKPTIADQDAVPHHLLDVADPVAGYSAAIFQKQAKNVIEDIGKRGKLPILVGGTGLYIDSILYDYGFLPRSDPTLRQKLNALSLIDLHQLASENQLDLTEIDNRNKRRVIRHIENNGTRPTRTSLRSNTLIIGISCEIEVLQARIVKRIDTMVKRGFADEVRQLGVTYGWDNEPMKAPGYRAFRDYIKGSITLDLAKERFMRNDLQLAKKQRTWFKRNESILWIENSEHAKELVEKFLTTNSSSLNN